MFDPLSHVIDHDPHPVPGQLLPQRLFDCLADMYRPTDEQVDALSDELFAGGGRIGEILV